MIFQTFNFPILISVLAFVVMILIFIGILQYARIDAKRHKLKERVQQGGENIDAIIDAADGIMIARGDMGVSLPIQEVPIIQKHIIKKCNAAGKLVITATQMLEHMTEHSRPTRAEVTDVANAIIDGTNFVMLSAETAVGRYPSQSVHMMNEIIKFTEKSMPELKCL